MEAHLVHEDVRLLEHDHVENLFDEVKTVSIQPLSLDQMVTVHHLRVSKLDPVLQVEDPELIEGHFDIVLVLDQGHSLQQRLARPAL